MNSVSVKAVVFELHVGGHRFRSRGGIDHPMLTGYIREGGHRPVDMMDKPDGLPTSPQAQQQQSGDKNYLKQAA